jgi:hypothetical protein
MAENYHLKALRHAVATTTILLLPLYETRKMITVEDLV